MSEPGHLGVKRAESAKLRRTEQLKRWKGSLTELEPVTPARSRHRGGPRVRFEDGAVFLAACSSGDTEEVKRLLARGARLNTANVDGLTALHQVARRAARSPGSARPACLPLSPPPRGWDGRRGLRRCLGMCPEAEPFLFSPPVPRSAASWGSA